MTVSESRVSGSIPVSLIRSACSPKRKVLLAKLDLGFNRLTGSLPEALSRCTGLQILNVSGNAMEGRIPPTLLPPLATNLFQFDVSHNNFSGTFPKEILKTLGVLGAFSIGSNRFSGTPPATLHASSSLSRYDVSNNNFKVSLQPLQSFALCLASSVAFECIVFPPPNPPMQYLKMPSLMRLRVCLPCRAT